MAGGGRGESNGNGRHMRSYERENTVLINVLDNNRVKARDVIESLCELLGEGAVYTCVAKASNVYEVTLADCDSAKVATCGVTVGQDTFDCTEIVQSSLVVSFMNMSGYIADAEIVSKLGDLGVEIIGDIKRRLHPGTKVEDGTRYMRVKFPPGITSLPYSMKFHNGKNWEHVRVIHNDQRKTCRQCMSTEHLYRDCPEFVCWKCGNQGHFARQCREPRCGDCGKFGKKCECDFSDVETVDSLEDCEYCGKCACDCLFCDWCDKPKQGCICSADDICKFCSVELENCQCVPCKACGKLDCWCKPSDGVDETVTSDHDNEEHTAGENNGPDEAAVTGDQATETNHVTGQPADSQPAQTSAPVTDAGGDRSSDGEQRREEPGKDNEKHLADNEENSIFRDSIAEISKVCLYPGGSQSSIMRPPSSAPSRRLDDGIPRKADGTLLHRRRRLVVEPTISPVQIKRKNIDSNCDID